MRVVLDSNEYIFGLSTCLDCPASIQLINKIPDFLEGIEGFTLIVPNIIRVEVHRNLPHAGLTEFYRLMRRRNIILRWADDVPQSLHQKYCRQMKEEDALIVAIAEVERVDCIVSDNRHFYEQLETKVFVILTAEQFLHNCNTGEIWNMIQNVRRNRLGMQEVIPGVTEKK